MTRTNDAMRFLFYSHDGLGLGHTRRHVAIASALVGRSNEANLLIATGADDINRLGPPPSVEVLKLPSLRKMANEQYGSRRLRLPAEEIRHLRSALLLATVEAFRPDVVLVDKHPFGAGGEFADALKAARRRGARTVLGLRDILDNRETVLAEWAPHRLQERIAEFYDRVLVYGQQAVFDPIAEYGLPPEVVARTRFCGYVVNSRKLSPLPCGAWAEFDLEERSRPIVLATAGGGEDGFHLMQHFIRAVGTSPWRGIAVVGPQFPDHELATLNQLARGTRVSVHTFVPNLPQLLHCVDALVCMGGYNTLAEAAAIGVPTVCVPRVRPREEQLIRARAFERVGLLTALPPADLTPARLATAITGALATSRDELLRCSHETLSFDGAANAVAQLLELAARPAASAPLESVA
ncbi:MAG TPA: glycosyltransferase [Verrucomicrobiae bacterium]